MLEYANPGVLSLTFSEVTLPGTWNRRLTTVLP
jgi:hypothetical protein